MAHTGLKVFARGCVENIKYFNIRLLFTKTRFCTLPHENSLNIKEVMKCFLSEYRYKIIKISHVILRLGKT